MNSLLLALGFSVVYLVTKERRLVSGVAGNVETKRAQYDDERKQETIGGDGTTSLGIRKLVETPLPLLKEEPWHEDIEPAEKARITSLLMAQMQQQVSFEGPASAPESLA